MRTMIGLIALFAVSACEAPEQDSLFAEAKEAVTKELKDPGSAKFEQFVRCGKCDYVIGAVNAKNSFGAYAGKRNFIYRDGVVLLEPDEYEEHYWSETSKCYQYDAEARGIDLKSH